MMDNGNPPTGAGAGNNGTLKRIILSIEDGVPIGETAE